MAETLANSIYRMLYRAPITETLPRRKAARVRVYSGEKPYITNRETIVERQGKWYAPYLRVINSGGRLLLACLRDVVEGWAGLCLGRYGRA